MSRVGSGVSGKGGDVLMSGGLSESGGEMMLSRGEGTVGSGGSVSFDQ